MSYRIISLLCLLTHSVVTSTQAALLVYEPFDYAVDLTDSVAGAQNGKNGGIGFGGAWEDMVAGSNAGEGFIFGSVGNTNLTNGAKPNWDGVVNNLPQSGGYVGLSPFVNDAQQDRNNARRVLAQSAGAMAGVDQILWMSMAVHFEDNRFFFAPGLALTSGGGFQDRVQNLSDTSNGLGVGNGGPPINSGFNVTDITASHYVGGIRDEATKTNVINLSTATADYLIVLKYVFGDLSDSVSAWAFTEDATFSETDFMTNATTLVSASNIDELSLTTLATGITRAGNAYDEIRIGDTYEDVTGGTAPEVPPFEITGATYDPVTGKVTLTWRSRPGKTYVAKFSRTMAVGSWGADLRDDLDSGDDEIPGDGDQITVTFDLNIFTLQNETELFFRIEEP